MNDRKESVFYRIYVWLRQNTLCRLGYHDIQKVFTDGEYPNPEYCTFCDFGYQPIDAMEDLQ